MNVESEIIVDDDTAQLLDQIAGAETFDVREILSRLGGDTSSLRKFLTEIGHAADRDGALLLAAAETGRPLAFEKQSGAEAEAPSPPGMTNLTIDDFGVAPQYANVCRVSMTPEEVTLDFALNPQLLGTGAGNVRVSARVIMSHYTAKRLLGALSMSLQRHERSFGTIEISPSAKAAKAMR